jgi:hypothetical protein
VKKEEAEGDKDGEEGGDEDAPPKVEVKEVKEEDAFYSIRYKFYFYWFIFCVLTSYHFSRSDVNCFTKRMPITRKKVLAQCI